MQELGFYVEILCLMLSAELKLLWKDLTLGLLGLLDPRTPLELLEL
jgi:hypothetical protein